MDMIIDMGMDKTMDMSMEEDICRMRLVGGWIFSFSNLFLGVHPQKKNKCCTLSNTWDMVAHLAFMR